MSYWNYRICKQRTMNPDEDLFAIHEVYYEKNGNIYLIADEPARVWGESPEDLKNNLAMLLEAFQQQIIDLDEVLPRLQEIH